MKLNDVLTSHNFDLWRVVDAHHAYSCTGEGFNVRLKSGRMLCAEKLGSLDVMRVALLLGRSPCLPHFHAYQIRRFVGRLSSREP